MRFLSKMKVTDPASGLKSQNFFLGFKSIHLTSIYKISEKLWFGKTDKSCAQKYSIKSNMATVAIATGDDTTLKNFVFFIVQYWPKMSAIAYLFQKITSGSGASP